MDGGLLATLVTALAGAFSPATADEATLWLDLLGLLLSLFTVPLLGIAVDAVRSDASDAAASFGRRMGPVFWRNLWGMVLMNLKVLLWTLLFIVPGLIAGYRYYFVPYLLADDDTLSVKEAFEKSKAMTDNRKFDLFLFDLSFLGWAFLVVFTFGLAAFYLVPYIQAARAQLYEELRA